MSEVRWLASGRLRTRASRLTTITTPPAAATRRHYYHTLVRKRCLSSTCNFSFRVHSDCSQARWTSSSSNPIASSSNRHDVPNTGNDKTDSSNALKDTLLPRSELELDFFGEPVTFLGVSSSSPTSQARAALDGFVLAIVSKGKTCIGGGEEEGMEVQSIHSSAIAWSELLRHATIWNNNDNNNDDNLQQQQSEETQTKKHAPMLVIAAVAPLLAQGSGKGYIQYLDRLLQQVSGRKLQLLPMAFNIIKEVNDNNNNNELNERERCHIVAMEYMLQYQYKAALYTYLDLLRACPGDVLALSLALDLANTVGDTDMALRAATSTAAYWNERKGGFIRPAIPGYGIACAYQALGLAVGGRTTEAEEFAFRTLHSSKKIGGAVSTWALAHVLDAQGRTAEGISFLANNDGIANYQGSGLLFFESRLATYGCRYLLDREEKGRGTSAALRLYESHIGRVLEYSQFAQNQAPDRTPRKAPLGWSETNTNDIEKKEEQEKNGTSSSGLFGFLTRKGENATEATSDTSEEAEVIVKESNPLSSRLEDNQALSCEDVLTWLPPTPQLLSDATLLLWRLTLNGTIPPEDYRWDHLRNAWKTIFQLEQQHDKSQSTRTTTTLEYAPLACMSASILIPPFVTGGDQIGTGRLAAGLYRMGELMGLGDIGGPSEKQEDEEESDENNDGMLMNSIKSLQRVIVAETHPNLWLPEDEESQKEWKSIVDDLISAMDGFDYSYDDDEKGGKIKIENCHASLRFQAWTFDARPLVDHAVVYAACKAGDKDSLCRARAICSQGVTLRPNSPEEWWRYSIVLGLLGDQVASEQALVASVNLGSGQGAKAI